MTHGGPEDLGGREKTEREKGGKGGSADEK